jgi:hypothetical protein
MATPKEDEAIIRTRDALLLPHKRKVASWAIRSDIMQANAKGKDAPARAEAIEKARNALPELDGHVFSLGDIKFPDAMKSKVLDAELAKLKKTYGDIRGTLVAIGETA